MCRSDSYKYVEDAVIFFIFNKVDCMRETDLINICKEFYEINEIEEAKNLIFEIYGKIEEKISRKGANKSTSDLQDIIKLVRITTPPENIKFCVTTCTRLPPVSLDHIDAGSLLKQVCDLRLQILKLSHLPAQINLLKKELEELKLRENTPNIRDNLLTPASGIANTPRVKDIVNKIDTLAVIGSEKNAKCDLINKIVDESKVQKDNSIYPNIDNLRTEILETEVNSIDPNTCKIKFDDDDISITSDVSDQVSTDFKNDVKKYSNNYHQDYMFKTRVIQNRRNSNNSYKHSMKKHLTKTTVNDSSWRRRLSNSSKSQNWRNNHSSHSKKHQHHQSGLRTVPSYNLRAAISRQSTTRDWSIFISRIDPRETVDTVRNHMLSVFGRESNIEVFKIRSKYNNYSSYKAYLSNIDVQINVLDSFNWPHGILVKNFTF